jgi:hypothetical protein
LGTLVLGNGDVGTLDSIERSVPERCDHNLIPGGVELGSADSTDVESPDRVSSFDRSSPFAQSGSCQGSRYLPGLGFFA